MTIYVTVSGGVVQGVSCNNEKHDVVIIDFDTDGSNAECVAINGDQAAIFHTETGAVPAEYKLIK